MELEQWERSRLTQADALKIILNYGEDNLLFEKKNTGFYATALAYEMK